MALQAGARRGIPSGVEQPDVDIDPSLLTDGQSERGIPKAVFIEDVPKFLERLGGVSVEVAMGAFNELYSKYRMYETNLENQRSTTKLAIPDIEKSLELVKIMQQKQAAEETVKTHFPLADTVYANAELDNDGKVCIWLGANVMVEYELEEARALLQERLVHSNRMLEDCRSDLDLVRNQVTTAEVNMARMFNYDVRARRERDREAAAGAGAIEAKP